MVGWSAETRRRSGTCTVAGVDAVIAQPVPVVIVTADPAALMDTAVPDCLNVTIASGGAAKW